MLKSLSTAAVVATATVGLTPSPARAQPKAEVGSSTPNPEQEARITRLANLIPGIRAALQGNDANTQRAALAILAEAPPRVIVNANASTLLSAYLQRDVADPTLVASAVRAYGRSFPPGGEIAKTLERAAKSDNATIRRAAADALANIINDSAAGANSLSKSKDFVVSASQAVPLLGETLAGDAETQAAAVEGIRQAARTAATFVKPSQFRGDPDEKPLDPLPILQPVTAAIGAVTPKLAAPLASADPATVAVAVRGVESVVALQREMLLRMPPGSAQKNPPLGAALESLVPTLARQAQSGNADARTSILEAVELIGDLPSTRPILSRAAEDPTVAVRWTAARALGRIGFGKPEPTAIASEVAALARLATDTDIDVRTTALNSLARIGPPAAAAVPAALASAGQGDVEPRTAAYKALTELGSTAETTVPVLIEGLKHRDARLRRAAATGLVRFGADAKPALEELRKAVQSNDSELRLAAGEAILAIERPARFKEL